MWLVDQLGGSNDPVFPRTNVPIKTTTNENDLAQWPSRLATDFLEDIIQRFKSLEWIPGGLYNPDDYPEFNRFKEMYLAAGWPENFDGEKFDRLHRESVEAEQHYRKQIGPLDELESMRAHRESSQSLRESVRELETEIRALQDETEQSSEIVEQIESQTQTLQSLRDRLNPQSPESWIASQDRTRNMLEEFTKERQLLLDRQGRFAGLTDEEYEEAIAGGWLFDMINNLNADLADIDSLSREIRKETAAREKVRALDPRLVERWIKETTYFKSPDWEQKWRLWYEAPVTNS
jgi:nicotinic acid mononucleotide adenylyltransferase